MKKTYIAPAMEMTEIAMVNMIAASLTENGGTGGNGITEGDAPFRGFDEEDLDLSDVKLW